jgi:hypothetical protein
MDSRYSGNEIASVPTVLCGYSEPPAVAGILRPFRSPRKRTGAPPTGCPDGLSGGRGIRNVPVVSDSTGLRPGFLSDIHLISSCMDSLLPEDYNSFTLLKLRRS